MISEELALSQQETEQEIRCRPSGSPLHAHLRLGPPHARDVRLAPSPFAGLASVESGVKRDGAQYGRVRRIYPVTPVSSTGQRNGIGERL